MDKESHAALNSLAKTAGLFNAKAALDVDHRKAQLDRQALDDTPVFYDREEFNDSTNQTGSDIGRNGAGSISSSPAGEDKTASHSLFQSLHKTAALNPINFIKNLSGANVRKAQNTLKQTKRTASDFISDRKTLQNYTKPQRKDLANAKADRNRARLGAGLAVGATGAGLGGYRAYQDSKNPQTAVIPEEQLANDQSYSNFLKVAKTDNNYIETQRGDHKMNRLFKTAAPDIRGGFGKVRDAAGNIVDNVQDAALGARAKAGKWTRDATGQSYRNVKRNGQNIPEDGFAGADRQQYSDSVIRDARNDMLKAQAIGAGALAGAGGLGYGAHAFANREKEEEQLAYEDLMNRLEKTAAGEEAQPGRQDRSFLAESLIGAGPYAHFAKKHNKLGVNPEDSHAVANAKASGVIGGTAGALYGAGLGALVARGRGAGRQALAAGGGAALGAGLIGGSLAAGNALVGTAHDEWDRRNPVGEEQLAYEDLMNRLEKTAAGEEGQPGRQDRRFLTETFLGAGPVGYWAKENNRLGVKEEDSHAIANAKVGAGGNAVLGGIQGAATGALLGHQRGQGKGKTALLSAGLGAAGAGASGLYGGLTGALNGHFHDLYDEAHPVKNPAGEEQLAQEDLMHRLSKTAAPNLSKLKGAAKDSKYKAQMFGRDLTGKNTKAANQNLQRFWDNDANKQLNKDDFQKAVGKYQDNVTNAANRQSKARRQAGIAAGAGAAGIGTGVTATRIQGSESEHNKKASETLDSLYKEAASAIVNESLPPVKQHVDPMNRIRFSS